jgi:acyl carrier protein
MNMTKQELLDDLMPVFVQILDDEDVVIGFSTTARDVDNWDSLNHLQLIVAIEKKYNVRFNSAEIDKFKTVGDILDTVLQKLN